MTLAVPCGSCRAPMLWTISAKGAKAPIDAVPSPEGNTLLLSPAGLGELLSVVLSGKALELARERRVGLRTNHYATCPDRKAWREKTDAKREGSA